jgi:hypothetical protein
MAACANAMSKLCCAATGTAKKPVQPRAEATIRKPDHTPAKAAADSVEHTPEDPLASLPAIADGAAVCKRAAQARTIKRASSRAPMASSASRARSKLSKQPRGGVKLAAAPTGQVSPQSGIAGAALQTSVQRLGADDGSKDGTERARCSPQAATTSQQDMPPPPSMPPPKQSGAARGGAGHANAAAAALPAPVPSQEPDWLASIADSQALFSLPMADVLEAPQPMRLAPPQCQSGGPSAAVVHRAEAGASAGASKATGR